MIWLNIYFTLAGFLPKAKELSWTNYLPIGGEQINSHPSPKVSAWSETQTASNKFWIRVTNSIFYDDNCYTKRASYIVIFV